MGFFFYYIKFRKGMDEATERKGKEVEVRHLCLSPSSGIPLSISADFPLQSR